MNDNIDDSSDQTKRGAGGGESTAATDPSASPRLPSQPRQERVPSRGHADVVAVRVLLTVRAIEEFLGNEFVLHCDGEESDAEHVDGQNLEQDTVAEKHPERALKEVKQTAAPFGAQKICVVVHKLLRLSEFYISIDPVPRRLDDASPQTEQHLVDVDEVLQGLHCEVEDIDEV